MKVSELSLEMTKLPPDKQQIIDETKRLTGYSLILYRRKLTLDSFGIEIGYSVYP